MHSFNPERRTLIRNLVLGLLLLCIASIVHGVFGQHGYLASRRQSKELESLQQQIQQLRDENERLGKENRALQSDPTAIERLAREQMHLAKPGEKIFTERAPGHKDPAK